MCAHHEKEGQSGYQNLTGVAWSILVMGLSLAAVIILWVWFGYIGPTFSEDVLANQQRTLRETFGLPVTETIDDPADTSDTSFFKKCKSEPRGKHCK